MTKPVRKENFMSPGMKTLYLCAVFLFCNIYLYAANKITPDIQKPL